MRNLESSIIIYNGTIDKDDAESYLHFKPDLNDGNNIYNQEKYDQLLGFRTEIANPGYFPKYRG